MQSEKQTYPVAEWSVDQAMTVTRQSLIFRHFHRSFILEDLNKNSVFRFQMLLENWIRFSPLTEGQLKVIRKKCYRNTPKFSHPSAPKYLKTKALRGSIQTKLDSVHT